MAENRDLGGRGRFWISHDRRLEGRYIDRASQSGFLHTYIVSALALAREDLIVLVHNLCAGKAEKCATAAGKKGVRGERLGQAARGHANAAGSVQVFVDVPLAIDLSHHPGSSLISRSMIPKR